MGPAALFVSALLLGGGGPHAPLLTGLIEGVALLVLVREALDAPDGGSIRPGARSAAVLVAAVLLLGLAQLVPLPAAIWQQLPGRTTLAATMAALGRSGEAWPISLSPPDTRSLLLAWLPPVAMFFSALRLGAEDRVRLVTIAVAVGLVSALLGMAQLIAGGGRLFPYGLPPFSRCPGLFANFNHQAMLLAACLPLIAGLAAEVRTAGLLSSRLLLAPVITLLVAGVVITSSRAGLALLVLGSGVALVMRLGAPGRISAARSSASRALCAQPAIRWLAAAGMAALAAASVAGSYRWQLMADRFGGTAADARFIFWPVVEREIAHYFPVGSGLGTFDIVYQAAEPLAQMQSFIVNHAHNDYLEWVLETGLAGGVLLALVFAWLLWRAIEAWRWPRERPGTMLGRAATGVILIVLLHSIVDYPLRTEAIGCLFSLACALLVAPPPTRGSSLRRPRSGSR